MQTCCNFVTGSEAKKPLVGQNCLFSGPRYTSRQSILQASRGCNQAGQNIKTTSCHEEGSFTNPQGKTLEEVEGIAI